MYLQDRLNESYHKILENKTYIGKIEHKGKVYEGLHDAIIDEEI